MPRIEPLNPDQATGRSAELLSDIHRKMGGVPNVLATLAQSPQSLEAYLAFSGALAKGQLGAKLGEQIALTVAGRNRCDYCASAHTMLAKAAGVSEEEARRALDGQSENPRTASLLQFVASVVERRGLVDDADVTRLRDAGFRDAEIIEAVAYVVVNIFTNYVNHISGTDIDFPVVSTENVPSAA